MVALLLSGCGLSEHAKKAGSLQKRIDVLETKFDRFVELDAQSVAEREAAQKYLKDAIKWLRLYIERKRNKQ